MNIWLSLCVASLVAVVGCSSNAKKDNSTLHFATAAEYPPFEYQERGRMKGFDIDLATLIANKLGKKAVFDNMQFSTILPALTSGQVDAAIATITITDARKKQFDFTAPYYFESIAAVFDKNAPIKNPDQLTGKKIAVQLGSTVAFWLKKHAPESVVVTLDNNNAAIAALKAGHVDLVLLDGPQGLVFSQKNPSLSFAVIAQSADGYGIALTKHSVLTAQINEVLHTLIETGAITALKKKWLEDASWRN
ncbi:MAG: ABC transporter substrate-binding protein [Legionellales bacterium]